MKEKKIKYEDVWGTHHIFITAAHRYCLGRRTYIVNMCVSWLKSIWDKIEPETKKRILIETQEAIDKELAGDECDVDAWKSLVKFIESDMEYEDETRL